MYLNKDLVMASLPDPRTFIGESFISYRDTHLDITSVHDSYKQTLQAEIHFVKTYGDYGVRWTLERIGYFAYQDAFYG